GLAGVVVLVGVDVAGDSDALLGTLLVVLAACGYAVGPMILKRKLEGLDARAAVGASLLIAGGLLALPAAASVPAHVTFDAGLAMVVLGLVCTALAFVVFSFLIREVGPSRALVITYLNPVVAVALGVAILGERPGAGAVAGLLLILAGSWLSTDGRMPPGITRAIARRRTAHTAPESPGVEIAGRAGSAPAPAGRIGRPA